MATTRTENYHQSQASDRVNVGQQERWASLAGGGLLTLWGMKRGSLSGLGLAALGGSLLYRGMTGHCPAYSTLDIDTSQSSMVHIHEVVTVDRSRDELYRFWRELENLPQFMRHLASVRKMDERRSVWTARAPRNLGTVTWEAEITEDDAGERIGWQSLPGADVENAGMVSFEDAPGGRGSIVRVTLDYRPPGGALTGAATGFINPALSQMLREDVRRFKSLMETGEVPTVEGQPTGPSRH